MSLDDRLIDIPTIVLAVSGSPSVTELTAVAERLKQNLADLPGLSRIELDGDADEQITLALDDAALYRLGLSPSVVLETLARRNRTLPGGFVVVAGRRVSVLPNSEFADIEAIRATPIELPDGSQVPLGRARGSLARSCRAPSAGNLVRRRAGGAGVTDHGGGPHRCHPFGRAGA